MRNSCCCFIVPPDLLKKYSRDQAIDTSTRLKLRDSFSETQRLKLVREAYRVAGLSGPRPPLALQGHVAGTALQHVFNCRHGQTLPGRGVISPATSRDAAVQTVYRVTARLNDFYEQVLGRHSVDGRGGDLVSSVHYLTDFDNAFWNGQQMVYGDGDGSLFQAFYDSPDVIGHELTHGITQHESALAYEGEAGALNESISDVFGAVFNQWLNQWDAAKTEGWLIGAGILGPQARGAGKTCLRDMITPAASHCLSPQPDSYHGFDPTADVHENSGIPNRAFALFARALGGNSWDTAIKTWYAASIDDRLTSHATFAQFAALSLKAARSAGGSDATDALRDAWKAVSVRVADTAPHTLPA